MSVDGALYISAVALALAGVPHCAVMCSAPCAAVTAGVPRTQAAAFHVARLAGYAAAGGLAAASVNTLQALGSLSPVFKPLWSLVHLAALLLGLWLLVYGRQPLWIERIGRRPDGGKNGSNWTPMRGTGRAAGVGMVWVAWPCGLLQSAILVAALADDAVTGAAVMASFAAVSGGALVAVPWVWRHVGKARRAGWDPTLGVRFAGLTLAAASAWAMGRGSWSAIAAYCGL